MWVMPMRSHGLRYRPLATGHHVGHVGMAYHVAWCPLTMWPCDASKMRGLCAVGHVGHVGHLFCQFQSLYPIL